VAPPLRVAIAAVVERPVQRVLPLTGTLIADLRTDLTANASGRVVKTFVERGQKVTQGQTIAQLDVRAAAASAAAARADVASAKTLLETAQAECDRYDALAARGAITKQEHDKQTANCRQQLAAFAVSQARATGSALAFSDGTIRAPFAGVVTERFVSTGDYVQASSKVVTLVVSDPLRLRLTVPERRIGEVREGSNVTFSPPSKADRTFTASIKYMSGEVREATRDVVIEAIVQNPDGALLPGMFVNANVDVGQHPMPVVPKSAVFSTGEDSSLYVVVNQHLELRIVMLGVQAGDDVAVEDRGVHAGDSVVINPSPSLYDGAPVER